LNLANKTDRSDGAPDDGELGHVDVVGSKSRLGVQVDPGSDDDVVFVLHDNSSIDGEVYWFLGCFRMIQKLNRDFVAFADSW
jgi:hypothetical protein